MKASGLKCMLFNYELAVTNLKSYGFVVREIDGYSDRPYYFIGVTTKEKEKTGSPWIWSSDTIENFIEKARIFCEGIKHGKNHY